MQFTASPKTEALNYDLILTSPALGSGIDITFPNEAREIDIVYGFLDRGSNDHLDFDQQLGRVRHPGAIKVWVRNPVQRGHSFQRKADSNPVIADSR